MSTEPSDLGHCKSIFGKSIYQPIAYDVERGSAPPRRVPVSWSTVIAHTRLTPALQSSSSSTRCPRSLNASRTCGAMRASTVTSPGSESVGPKRIRKTVADDARGFDRLLRLHSELDDIEEHLQHPLYLCIPAGTTKRHERLSVSQNHRGVRGEPWTLPRLQAGGVRGIEPYLRAPPRDGKT